MNHAPELTDALLRVDGRVATLTLNRDDLRNELTGTKLVDDIDRTVQWINAEESIGVLIVTGAGNAFSSGGNIKHMFHREGSFGGDVYEVQKQYRQGIQRIPLAMHRLDVPSIAAINGAALGAGFDLACMCDLRLAAADAIMGETFVNVGIIPGDGGAWFLQRLVGYQRAAELTFSGRTFTGVEGKELGVVLDAVSADQLLETAQQLARSLAAKPPQALRLTKRLMKSAQRMELHDFLDHCAVFQGMCHNTDDHLEALAATIEKRAPQFKGQ
ncbi:MULTISPECIES: enoyl-CoA hydratase-related protein [unclassified Paraburkholderia]|uniref:enoyl-CoA hydratase-related protein n=1 Tax=unclassified Paraburkholderia TaxID=2615204 RepID=UPI00160DB6BF|nr:MULTISPECIES: enoyl-CoA hydratase-related protein [unclassified Paraburkholderia]MBB5447376.1 enoyl-CoA hydratase/carnithine racemase [Paraburkholderia sp. WSM4177]MBB5484057.1 enoyl-CoA hydratase/carnithine racemase [Paraburkholderia sp. WSM4180]